MYEMYETGSHLSNANATVTVINNLTANIGTGTNSGTPNGDFSVFKNIAVPNGSF